MKYRKLRLTKTARYRQKRKPSDQLEMKLPDTTNRAPLTVAEDKAQAHYNSVAWRIANALNTTPQELAVVLGVSAGEIGEMFKGSSGQSAIVAGHPAWQKLGALVDEQMGILLAVRAEIEAKRGLDAARLKERIARAGQ